MLEGVNQLMPAVGFAAGGVVTALTSPRAPTLSRPVGVALVALALVLRPIDRVRLTSPSDRDTEPDGGTTKPRPAQENQAACRTREITEPQPRMTENNQPPSSGPHPDGRIGQNSPRPHVLACGTR